MAIYPDGIESRTITGKYADMYFDQALGEYKTRPKKGFVYIYPAVTEIKLLATNEIIDLDAISPQRVPIDVNGEFTFDAIVTNQSAIIPNNSWTYKLVPSWGEKEANLPISAGTGMIDVNEYIDAEVVPGYIITKGDPGVGVETITSAGNLATVHYTDGSTSTFELPIGDGTGGSTPDATTEVKGKLKLAGDLAGSADVPVIGVDKIDSTKLAPAVRTSLGKADSAVQPAGLTKAAVGLGNVDNTSDVNKPVSSATQTALNLKVNISSLHPVATSGSYNDLTAKPTIPSTKADIGLGNVDNTSDLNKPISTLTQTALNGKANTSHTHSQYIQSVNGTTPDGTGAVEIEFTTDWSDITNIPTTFTPSAHTHAYSTLTGIPSTFAPSAHTHVAADVTDLSGLLDAKANTAHTHLWADITDKPTTFAPSAHTHTATQISDSTTTGRSLLTATDAAAARATIGAGTSSLALGTTGSTAAAGNHTHAYSTMTGIPSTFTPSAHTHTISDVTSLQSSLDGKAATVHTHSTADVTGLDAALAAKANSSALTTKADLVGGKIPTSQIPNESLIRAVFVNDTTEMLALTIADVQNGDIARVIGESSYYTLIDDSNIDDINSWFYTPAPTGGSETVLTVNGQVGDVVLGKADVGLANVDNTSDLNKPISTATQTALDDKSDVGHTHVANDISNASTVGKSVLTAADAATARAAIGAGTGNSNLAIGTTGTTAKAGNYVPDWSEITSIPTTFTPSSHTHAISDTTGLQAALDAKAPLASPTFTGTVSGITKAMVGLANVDNTSDANKPVSTAQQTALDGKSNTGHTHAYSSLTGIPSTFAPSAHTHAISEVTSLQTSLDAKAPVASPTFTGVPAAPTATAGTNTTQLATTAFVTAGLATKAATSHTHLWADITDKPTTFAPSAHSHATSDVTGLDTALSGKEPTITAGTTAQYWRGDKSWQTLNKAAVGLGNVDNTSDTTKFTDTALTGTPTATTATAGNNSTRIATTAYVDTGLATKAATSHTHAIADTTGLQSALDLKAPLASPAFTGTVTGITKTMVGLGSVDNISVSSMMATERTATATLTGKTISGASNTLSNIAQSSVTNLTTDLGNKINKAGTATTLWSGTQSQYDSIGTKDSGTIYIVTA